MIFRRIPVRTLLIIASAWAFLAAANLLLLQLGVPLGTPRSFPISVFRGPSFHITGLPYAVAFAALLWFASRRPGRMGVLQASLAGLLLIVLGNLAGGGIDAAFRAPFTEGTYQYYHDAIRIESWRPWIGSFNSNQTELLMHARTHPPFAVLLHYAILELSGGRPVFLGLAFTLLAGLSLPLLYSILRSSGAGRAQGNRLILLFAVIPAVNIYGASCLDGVILAFSSLFLAGAASILDCTDYPPPTGVIALCLGLLLTNMLTFGGIFLLGAGGLIGIWQYLVRGRKGVLIWLAIAFLLLLATLLGLEALLEYDHLKSFRTACSIENPEGFRLLHAPLAYIGTRIESVCEVALFLSLGLLAMMFHPQRSGFSWTDLRSTPTAAALSGIISLLAMLLCGAFRTGETARAALFLYPYLLLPFVQTDQHLLRELIIFAGLQTIIMQLFGGYFW